MSFSERLQRHYGRTGIASSILQAISDAGLEGPGITTEALAGLDEFHLGGRPKTLELADLAGLRQGERILDLGCGVGGPARALAERYGCAVTGVDACTEFCDAARALTELSGLSDRVSFMHGDATEPPVEAGAFNVVWLQHMTMNIFEKHRLIEACQRALGPGGRLAAYEILAGAKQIAHFPLPWASDASLSHLASPSEFRLTLDSHGFRVDTWRDVTDDAAAWLRRMRERRVAGEAPALSLSILMGPEFPQMAANLLRNVEEGRVCVVQVIARAD